MKLKLVKRDNKYGCFIAGFNCTECGKTLISKGFNYGRDRIGIADNDKIKEELLCSLREKEINYCCKCGNEINS